MPRASDIAAHFATWFGTDLDQVRLTQRRLREQGLFVREVKGPKSPRANARHCANLVAALMADGPASSAAAAVETMRRTKLTAPTIDALREKGVPDDVRILKRHHSFVDALDWFIRAAVLLKFEFEEIFGDTEFWVERGVYRCGIELDIRGHEWIPQAALRDDGSGVQYFYEDHAEQALMVRRTALPAMAIGNIGRMLAGDPQALEALKAPATYDVVAEALAEGLRPDKGDPDA
ncbi:hypothetical protein [Aquibaculum sediminis]|uniref:hypothetical protein n=1 Tax=Aquibaculum sediminis TaxID=3231907 RepID=UPI003456EF34